MNCYQQPFEAPWTFWGPFLKPKKSGPDQRVPVISRAISDKLRYRLPWNSKPVAVTETLYVLPCHSRISRVPGLTGRRSICSLPFPFSREMEICFNRRRVVVVRPPKAFSWILYARMRTMNSLRRRFGAVLLKSSSHFSQRAGLLIPGRVLRSSEISIVASPPHIYGYIRL